MPRLEAMKALITVFVGHSREARKPRTLAMYDINRSQFYGVPKRRLFIELPEEEHADIGDVGDYVGLLKRMYGTVDAAASWQANYSEPLKKHGFTRGASNPALMYHPQRDIRLPVHGDDFMVEMPSDCGAWFESILSSRYGFTSALDA